MYDLRIAIIKLTREQISIVDDSLAPSLNEYKWFAAKTATSFYAARNAIRDGKRIVTYMHRDILIAGPLEIVDHINRDTLDNRMENLRIVDRRGNALNTGRAVLGASGYKGVVWVGKRNRWWAYATLQGKQHSLGYYEDMSDAVEARAKWDAMHPI